MLRHTLRTGFTLVELLVVISIIGMLMALLLPAVMSARESGRANTCRNNMRNLALAVSEYEVARNLYPGFRNDVMPPTASGPAVGGLLPNNERSWIFVILPYMDQRSAYDQFTSKNAAGNLSPGGTPNAEITMTLEACICPSNPAENQEPAANSYVANTGQIEGAANSSAAPYNRAHDFPGNGIFHDRRKQPAAIPVVSMNSAYLTAGDGLGNTLMLSENVDAARWTGGFFNSNVPIAPSERWMGFTYHSADGTPGANSANPFDPMAINVRVGQSRNSQPQNFLPGYARPSSYHPAGINAAFCDSHVRFLSDTISYGVYQALMTPRGQDAKYTINPPSVGDARVTALPAGHAATKIVDAKAIQ